MCLVKINTARNMASHLLLRNAKSESLQCLFSLHYSSDQTPGRTDQSLPSEVLRAALQKRGSVGYHGFT